MLSFRTSSTEEKAMSGLGKLKSLFVTEDAPAAPAPAEDAAAKAPVKAAGRAGAANRAAAPATEDEDTSDEAGSEVNNDILANLEKALDDNMPKTYGYLQLRDALAKMKKKIPNEASRFAAALAAAEASGADTTKILATADDAIAVLKGEQSQFNSEIAGLTKADDAKAADLKDIEDQIKVLTSKQTKINKELAASADTIQTKKQQFQVTIKSLIAEITADKEKVSEYSTK
jgi:chromosome segregation ATPase